MLAALPSDLASGNSVRQVVKNTFIHTPLPPTTPMRGSRRRAQSVPKDMGAHGEELEAPYHDLICLKKPLEVDRPSSAETAEGSSSESDNDQNSRVVSSEMTLQSPGTDVEDPREKIALEQRRPLFRPSVSLTLEAEAMVSPEPAVRNQASISLTPAKLSRRGPVIRFVKNTFIHAAAPPQTPSPASANRGQSVPRTFGSEKGSWEPASNLSRSSPYRKELTTPRASSPALLCRGYRTPTPMTTPECRQWRCEPFDSNRIARTLNLSSPCSCRSRGPVLRLIDLL